MYSLAHLSDLHLPLRPGSVRPGELSAKQMLAWLALRRRRLAGAEQLDAALLADLAVHAPDHVAVTGDLVNLAAAHEFEAARAWLDRLGPPGRVSVVPGNHDMTIARPWPAGIGLWDGSMQGDTPGGFPFLRRRGPLALIGLSSAVPTPVGFASGRLGDGQLRQLPALLEQAAADGLFRVVLIHHPPTMGDGGPRKALRDRPALRAVLERCGAELVLHGHHHVTRLVALPGPAGPIPECGVAQAAMARHGREAPGWRLYRIGADARGWRLASHGRRYDLATNRFRGSGAWTMHLPRARKPGRA